MMPKAIRNRIEEGLSPEDCRRHRYNEAEKNSLRRLATSLSVSDKRRCYEYLRVSNNFQRNGLLFLELADALIPSRSQTIRWGTLSLLGDYCQSHPEALWPMVVKWGSVSSEDIRGGVACCILEHLLQYHFHAYFERAKVIILNGNKPFAYTLGICYKFGEAEEPENAAALDTFLASLRGHSQEDVKHEV